MEIIGLDLHKRESQLAIQAEDGTITDRRIATNRERFTAVLGARSRARILLEASTESEWVARQLESLGHDVIVADPNYAPMYANRSRRTKTDKRDARALLDACATGAYRPAYRLSEARRHVRAELAVRDALVRTRTRYIALAKALVRRDGLRVPTSAFVATIDDITRFRSAHDLEAYLGVVPRERSSGEKRQLGRTTKAGNGRLRSLLVEAGWQILRSKSSETAPLRAWTRAIAQRRGKRIAVVALARRLAGILYATWRDGVPYDAQRIRPLAPAAPQAVAQRAG